MESKLGQYQYNSYLKPQYNQNQQQMTGNNVAIPAAVPIDQVKSSPVGEAASGLKPTSLKSAMLIIPSFLIAVGSSLGIKAGIDNVTTGATIESTKLYKGMAKVDKVVNNSWILSHIDKGINTLKDSIKSIKTPKSMERITNSYKVGSQPKWAMVKSNIFGLKGQGIDEVINQLNVLNAEGALKGTKVPELLEQIAKKSQTSYEAYGNILKELTDKNLCGLVKNTPAKLLGIKLPQKWFKSIDIGCAVNKVKVLEGKTGNTFLSRLMSKSTIALGESVSGAVVGGIAGLLFNAVFTIDTIKKTLEAPKGEKLSTFMEDFWGGMVANFLLMPVFCQMLYNAGGLRFIGTSEKKVLAKVNEMSKLIANKAPKAEINAAKKALRQMNSLKGIKWYEKPLKLFGKVITMGGIYRTPASTAPGKVVNFFKGGAGAAMRFAIVMTVLTPPICNLIVKMSHKVFGQSTKSRLAEESSKKAKLEKQANKKAKKDRKKSTDAIVNGSLVLSLQQMNHFLNLSKYPNQLFNKPATKPMTSNQTPKQGYAIPGVQNIQEIENNIVKNEKENKPPIINQGITQVEKLGSNIAKNYK